MSDFLIDRDLPPLNALRAFEAAARRLNLSRAADELRVTHAAVSRQVAILEDWIGAPLFRRAGRGVTLTEAGALLHAEAGGAFDRIAAAARRLRVPTAPQLLRVNTLPTFAMRWLIPRLSRFLQQAPRTEVRIATSIEPVAALTEPFDVAVRRDPTRRPGLAATPFLLEECLPVCAPRLLVASPPRQPLDLTAHTLLHAGTRPTDWADWFKLAGYTGAQAPKNLRFEHFYFVLQAALDGLGIAVAPLPLVAEDLAAGRLVAALPGPRLTSRPYYLIVADPIAGEPARRFAAWLVEEGRA